VSPRHRTCDDAAGIPAPNAAEVVLTRFALHGVLGGVYRRYVDGMGLRGDEHVLDFGSGSGAAARHLAKRLEAGGGRLTCVDISPGWQRVVRKTLSKYGCVAFELGDIRELDLPVESYDVVLVHWMLHDVPAADRPSVLARLRGLLHPGGQLFIREPTREGEGLPAEGWRGLLDDAGLTEVVRTTGKMPLLGPYYSGVWERPRA
jgi:ubiquinone/menaquinone biosynthesis C-methylase UbiE